MSVEQLSGVQACSQAHPRRLHHILATVKASPARWGEGLCPCQQVQVITCLVTPAFRHDSFLTGSLICSPHIQKHTHADNISTMTPRVPSCATSDILLGDNCIWTVAEAHLGNN